MRGPFRHLAIPCAALALAAAAPAQTNLALTGTATQSTTAHSGDPARGIDGNTDSNWGGGSITHTGNFPDSWWEVDLGGTFSISEVRLYNRQDCCWLRLSNFRVSIFDGATEVFGEDFFTASGSVPAGGTQSVLPPAGTSGDRVQVRILGMNHDGNGYLSLAEVEVYDGLLGGNYCGPAFPNSTGAGATITVQGSGLAGGAPLNLRADGLPADQFGIFLASQTQSFANPVGSTGILCLGGNMAIFNAPGNLRNSGTAGSFELDVDTTNVPTNPASAVLPGETWNFQAWFRDRNPGVTSNFTDGASIVFQ